MSLQSIQYTFHRHIFVNTVEFFVFPLNVVKTKPSWGMTILPASNASNSHWWLSLLTVTNSITVSSLGWSNAVPHTTKLSILSQTTFNIGTYSKCHQCRYSGKSFWLNERLSQLS